MDLMQLITLEIFNKFCDEPLDVLRHYFEFYAENNDFMEGLNFFKQFPSIIKTNKFNSLKAFLFYFAYQTKRYNSPQVKALLGQELLNVNITDPKIYLEFCMYCFYKGLYYIEKKDFFMASYVYCAAVEMGLRGNNEEAIFLNQFSMQMIRSLCFLKSLSEFDIKSCLYKEKRINHFNNDITKHENIDQLLTFIKENKNDYQSFSNFTKTNKDMISNYKLKGLKNEAEEAIIFSKIKENLFLYKKIKMTKLAQITQVEFNDLMKVIKKKVMAGEMNVKYDEANDILEVFDVDPGMKERVRKTKELYNKIIDANKNLFITIKDRKCDELSGAAAYSNEEVELLKRKHQDDYIPDDDYNAMDMEMDLDED